MYKKNKKIKQVFCPRNCPNACPIRVLVQDGKAISTTSGTHNHYTSGKICAKGNSYIEYIYNKDRITTPLIKKNGTFQEISWDEIIDIIAGKMLDLYREYGNNLSLCLNQYSGNMGLLNQSMEHFFSSLGGTTIATGSPCWSAGLDAVIIDFGAAETSDLSTLEESEVIIIWGANPAVTSIHAFEKIMVARERGAKVIAIDPIKTITCEKVDWYIQINPATDGSFALAVAKFLLENNLLDKNFIQQFTLGFPEIKRYLTSLNFVDLLKDCGQTMPVIIEFAELIAKNPTFFFLGYGLQRNENGGQNVRAINLIATLTGNIGKRGTGIQYANLATWNMYKYAMNKCENKKGRCININNFGAEIGSLNGPPVRLLWFANRNPFSQNLECDKLLDQLEGVDMIITSECFMTKTAQASDIILPITTFFESYNVVSSYAHHYIGINEPVIAPLGESKSDLDVLRLLVNKLNSEISGFSNFPDKISDVDILDKIFTEEIKDKLTINDWRELNRTPKKNPLLQVAFEDKMFPTPSGKIELISNMAEDFNYPAMVQFVPRSRKNGKFLVFTQHQKHSINSQFLNIKDLNPDKGDVIGGININIAKKLGLENNEIYYAKSRVGKLKFSLKTSPNIHPEILLLTGDLAKINAILEVKFSDLGEITTGAVGQANNSTWIEILAD